MNLGRYLVESNLCKVAFLNCRVVTEVLYICVSCWLLARESQDLSQTETKIALVKSRTNSQNDSYFHGK